MFLNKTLVSFLLLTATAVAEDAASLLEKARDAFAKNHERERYWIWTSVSARSMLDRSGKVVETLPSVTTESLIRGDGKRCSAVLAWGDGVEAYKANASAEERCQVLEEAPPIFRVEAVLQTQHAKLKARSEDEITLAIHSEKQAAKEEDAAARCAESVEGTIGLDPVTYFPKRVDLKVVGEGCKQRKANFEEHYGAESVKASGGMVKGSHILTEYELEKDKTGNPARDFWIASHQRREQPTAKNVSAILINGRMFMLESKGQDRIGVLEVTTKATEATAESVLKFEIPK